MLRFLSTLFLISYASCFLTPQTKVHIHCNSGPSDTVASAFSQVDDVPVDLDVHAVVCGGGPAGLLSAIMLAQKFPGEQIHLYERLGEPPKVDDDTVWNNVARFYSLGVTTRGKRALEAFGVWQDVKKVSAEVVGSQSWRPGASNYTRSMFTDMGRDPMYTLPRDKLVAALHEHIVDNYAGRIKLHYRYEVVPLDFAYGGANVLLEVSQCASSDQGNGTGPECGLDGTSQTVRTRFVHGADGSARTVANRMEQVEKEERASMNLVKRMLAGRPFRVTRFVDDNQRVYKTIPFHVPSNWRPDLSYSAHEPKRRFSMVCLPVNSKGAYCAVLLIKKDETLAQADTDPKELRALFDEHFPQFSQLLDDEEIARIAKKPPSNFPFFRYAGPRLHKGDCTVVLGDSAHTVKPYNGLGVNSAFEDVQILGEILDRTDNNLKDAVQTFSKERAADSKALVTLSRAADRPGLVGFIGFILPIMMDAFFIKTMPGLFAAPVPALVQDETYRFAQAARRKRIDRSCQVLLVSVFSGALFATAKRIVMATAKLLGKRPSTVALFTALPFFSFLAWKKYVMPDIVQRTKS